MKKLTIVKEEENNYILNDNEGTKYNLTLEFHDIDIKPTIQETLYMSENLLDRNNEQYNTYYVFGALESPYGKQIKKENDEDIIIIQRINQEKIILKRLYG